MSQTSQILVLKLLRDQKNTVVRSETSSSFSSGLRGGHSVTHGGDLCFGQFQSAVERRRWIADGSARLGKPYSGQAFISEMISCLNIRCFTFLLHLCQVIWRKLKWSPTYKLTYSQRGLEDQRTTPASGSINFTNPRFIDSTYWLDQEYSSSWTDSTASASIHFSYSWIYRLLNVLNILTNPLLSCCCVSLVLSSLVRGSKGSRCQISTVCQNPVRQFVLWDLKLYKYDLILIWLSSFRLYRVNVSSQI